LGSIPYRPSFSSIPRPAPCSPPRPNTANPVPNPGANPAHNPVTWSQPGAPAAACRAPLVTLRRAQLCPRAMPKKPHQPRGPSHRIELIFYQETGAKHGIGNFSCFTDPNGIIASRDELEMDTAVGSLRTTSGDCPIKSSPNDPHEAPKTFHCIPSLVVADAKLLRRLRSSAAWTRSTTGVFW
jgi:hypothetical protein